MKKLTFTAIRKGFLAATFIFLSASTALAVPAKRISRTLTQPDGTTVTVTLTGDERFHSYITSDGLMVAITPEGHAIYPGTAEAQPVYVHEAALRTPQELKFIEANNAKIDYNVRRASAPRVLQAIAEGKLVAKKAPLRAAFNGRTLDIESTNEGAVGHIGTPKIPVILVQYTDIKFRDGANAKETISDFCANGPKSVRQYFKDQSLGKYEPQFEFFGPYTLSQNRKYYGGTDSNGNDEKTGAMVKEGCQLAKNDVDFSNYDNDGDGYADVVIVMYAGTGQNSSGDNQAVWPCMWNMVGSGEKIFSLNGVKINEFAVFNELNGEDPTQIDGIGTFCHEFSHCLGLPDFYTTVYNSAYGMDAWSLMDYGSYNDDGYTPIGYSAYEKAFMGWIDLEVGKPNTKYSLPVLSDPNDPQSKAVVLVNEADNDEYFIFENRARKGWDEFIAEDGMLITHVTYDRQVWKDNEVNNTVSFQRMSPVPADNTLTPSSIIDTSALKGDLWPQSYAHEFTDNSTPAAKTFSGSRLHQPVTEIEREEATGIVSFWVDRQALPSLVTPSLSTLTGGAEAGSLTATWAAENGDDATYTLQVWPASSGLPAASLAHDFTKNKSDWDTEGYVGTESNRTRLGSRNNIGALISPASISPADGSITLVANAESYSNDANINFTLSLLDASGNEVASQRFETTQGAAYYSAAFNGLNDNAKYSMKIATVASAKRIFLYSALAFAGSYPDCEDSEYDEALAAATGSTAAKAPAQNVSGDRITVEGITGLTHTLTGLQAIEYRVRVKAVPVDATSFAESDWSETKTIDLASGGIADILGEAPAATYRIVGGEVIATPGSRLYTASGVEVAPVSAGRFAPVPGAYILVTPGLRPAKLILR